MLTTAQAFRLLQVNQRYRKYRPSISLKGHKGHQKWWKYAYNATIQEVVRPFSWQAIKKHRYEYSLTN